MTTRKTADVLARNAEQIDDVSKAVFDFAPESRHTYQVEVIHIEDYEGVVVLRNEVEDLFEMTTNMDEHEKMFKDMFLLAEDNTDVDYEVRGDRATVDIYQEVVDET